MRTSKFIIGMLTVASIALASVQQYTYDTESGLFTANQTGEVVLTVVPNGANFGHVNEFGYFVESSQDNLEYLTHDLKAGEKTFKFSTHAGDKFGFFFGIVGESSLRKTTNPGAANWFEFNSTTSSANVLIYHSEGFGVGADEMMLFQVTNIINDPPEQMGAPLPGVLTSVVTGAAMIFLLKKRKKQS